MRKLRLTREERQWLRAYRAALRQAYPGTVKDLLIYGSKARGTADSESDLDVLLIVSDGAQHLKRPLRRIGYSLAASSAAVPSILAYTEAEWEERARLRSPFHAAVEREGIHAL